MIGSHEKNVKRELSNGVVELLVASVNGLGCKNGTTYFDLVDGLKMVKHRGAEKSIEKHDREHDEVTKSDLFVVVCQPVK